MRLAYFLVVFGVVPASPAATARAAHLAVIPASAPEASAPLASEAGAVRSGARTVSDLLERARELKFELGTATLVQASLAFVDELAAALAREPSVSLEIVVHTADSGEAKKDLALSRRRSEAIRRALVDKGARTAQLLATGRGSEDPIAPNLTRVGRLRNERVELHRASAPRAP
jgi:outer membrane protein OmpA-like peptidoglycan-associated protein